MSSRQEDCKLEANLVYTVRQFHENKEEEKEEEQLFVLWLSAHLFIS